MHETDADIAALQDLLDRSYDAAGSHLRGITTPERRVSATQLCEQLIGMTLLEIYVPRYGDKWEQFIDPPDGDDDAPVYFRIDGDKMFSFQMVGEPSL